MIDAVVATEDLPALIDLTLAVLVDPAVPPGLPLRAPGGGAELAVWDAVAQTRRTERLGVREIGRAHV